ncbi:MAG: tyrosine-protein phosphatase [Mediterranea sp.]|jgi:protein-tyrosine phosphatase|nr:tyrosine-protein phosphatase [Mediterranea sp.]
MYKQLFGWLVALMLYLSCSGNPPVIVVACEEDPKVGRGNCMIKWETTPVIEGKVKIYASTDPADIPEKNPVLTADISEQRVTIVISDPTQRYYYKMVFDNRYRMVTASRNSVIPNIQNFRDIGGYTATKGKQVRWGMLYRSAQIEGFSGSTLKELKNIGIKTVIDLRTAEETAKTPPLEEQGFNVVRIPIETIETDNIVQKLRDGQIKNDSVSQLIRYANREIVTSCLADYRKMFDVLEEKDNYPVLISCATGINRTAIATAVILSALGVNEETVMSDYLRSNDFFDIPHVSGYGYQLPVRAQEAITTLFSAREEFLNVAMRQMEKNYGSVPTYLKKGIGLTDEDKRKLCGILLH